MTNSSLFAFAYFHLHYLQHLHRWVQGKQLHTAIYHCISFISHLYCFHFSHGSVKYWIFCCFQVKSVIWDVSLLAFSLACSLNLSNKLYFMVNLYQSVWVADCVHTYRRSEHNASQTTSRYGRTDLTTGHSHLVLTCIFPYPYNVSGYRLHFNARC